MWTAEFRQKGLEVGAAGVYNISGELKEADMTDFTERMIRAARLDPAIYEEIEADTTALGPAMAVVLLSSVAAGIGSIPEGGGNLVLVAVLSLASWYLWAFLAYLIGTKLLPEPQTRSDMGELLRIIGFSSSPGILRIVGIVPGLTSPAFFIANLWMLAAMVVAVRQALDYKSTGRAVAVCFISWLLQVVAATILMGWGHR